MNAGTPCERTHWGHRWSSLWGRKRERGVPKRARGRHANATTGAIGGATCGATKCDGCVLEQTRGRQSQGGKMQRTKEEEEEGEEERRRRRIRRYKEVGRGAANSKREPITQEGGGQTIHGPSARVRMRTRTNYGNPSSESGPVGSPAYGIIWRVRMRILTQFETSHTDRGPQRALPMASQGVSPSRPRQFRHTCHKDRVPQGAPPMASVGAFVAHPRPRRRTFHTHRACIVGSTRRVCMQTPTHSDTTFTETVPHREPHP